MRHVLIFSLAFVSACGPGIDGDWFRCAEPGCDVFHDGGLRLRADDTFTVLEANGTTLEPDESYCELKTPSTMGMYVHEAGMLTTTSLDGREETVAFRVEDEGARVRVGETDSIWRRIPSRSFGPCGDNGKR